MPLYRGRSTVSRRIRKLWAMFRKACRYIAGSSSKADSARLQFNSPPRDIPGVKGRSRQRRFRKAKQFWFFTIREPVDEAWSLVKPQTSGNNSVPALLLSGKTFQQIQLGELAQHSPEKLFYQPTIDSRRIFESIADDFRTVRLIFLPMWSKKQTLDPRVAISRLALRLPLVLPRPKSYESK